MTTAEIQSEALPERRDITKCQRAMGVAFNFPDPEKGGRGGKSKNASEFSEALGIGRGHAQNLIYQARAVLADSRDLAIAVRNKARIPTP